MATPAQINANRANALKSTGPRSAEGKSASRFNALKHGIDAASVVIPGEDPADYDALAADYHRDFRPESPSETFYVDTMVFDPEMLRHLVDTFGADRVLMGTDYPYDMGEEHPRELIAQVKDLSADEVARIEGLNAVKLLNITPVR